MIREYAEGRLVSERHDTNGDGRNDLWVTFDEQGEKVLQEEDTDYDGRADVRFHFQDGSLATQEMLSGGPPEEAGGGTASHTR